MIRRHRELYRELDHLYEIGGDDATDAPEYMAAADEATALASRIVAAPAATQTDVAAKRRFIREMNFLDQDSGFLGELIQMILRLDAEADGVVATGKPIVQVEADTTA
jgi:hypothetical protein